MNQLPLLSNNAGNKHAQQKHKASPKPGAIRRSSSYSKIEPFTKTLQRPKPKSLLQLSDQP
ncbi:hypothetical protein T4A_7663 [Trichinella pseudospiralis]|uniref:Uncharacterized protein n=1 Tax=Trichinella pseudospiralis TaxID=6337 RepID=A0A0V0XMX7_TRIPS|nr:hypothetical protein T4E_4230 [Trichinella pseudospiralis]KRY67275.1 hypothetical protein T4A_7663 [Trichinella pseudospiralis]